MKKKRLLTLLTSGCILLVLVVVMPLVAACTGPAGLAGAPGAAGAAGAAGPAGKAGAKGPSGAAAVPSEVSLAVVPPVQVAKRGNTITLLGSGLKPGEEISVRISRVNGVELDVTLSGQDPFEVNENGAFEIVLGSGIRVRSFPAGVYTVMIVGRGGEILATAPLNVVKPKK